jgi:hypothetical protein
MLVLGASSIVKVLKGGNQTPQVGRGRVAGTLVGASRECEQHSEVT